MADKGTPHFHNEPGVRVIHVGSKEFMCIGAKPPLDHPHIFIDMGYDTETVCPIARPCSGTTRPWVRTRHGRPNACGRRISRPIRRPADVAPLAIAVVGAGSAA